MSSPVGACMANVPWTVTALKHCIVIDSCWKSNALSRESSDSCEMRLPSSFKNWNRAMFSAPKVSMTMGTKILVCARWAYFNDFLSAAASAAPPDSLYVDYRYDWAKMSVTVTSQVTHLPFFHGICVRPSGLFLSDLNSRIDRMVP